MSNRREIIKNIVESRKLKKSITRHQYRRHVETVKGQRGYRIKSRAKGEYEIHIRWNDTSFNWLGWDNPHMDIWDMIFAYPDKTIKWIYDTTGYNLDNISEEELTEFLYKTGMIVVKGNPTKYGYAKANLIISNFYETLVNSLERYQK